MAIEIKNKYVLKDKSEVVNLPTVKELLVTLSWSAEVDLDLMAFYKKKDGGAGGVFSNAIPGGTQGSLNEFPYMLLSDDQGIEASAGDKSEELKIAKLDDINRLYIIALNYSEAKKNNPEASFSAYDGKVTVLNEKGEAFEVPLQDTAKGTAALICTIDNTSAVGAKLKRDDKIMTLPQFIETIPGAILLTK